MDLNLTGKRAVIVGGSRGIGYAIAQTLAAEGARVAIAARNSDTLEQERMRLAVDGGEVLAIKVDTQDDASVRSMVDSAVRNLGGIDILVNAAARPAGQAKDARSLADLRDDDLRTEIETKVLGYLRTARAAAPDMMSRGWGRIINIGGMNARRTGSTFGSIRNVAVAAMTKNLSDELAPHGVNVSVVHPAMTATERTASVVEMVASTHGLSLEDAESRLANEISIGRLVTAQEIAFVVAFLASPRSVAITGDAIAVGGGVPGPIYY